MQPIVSRFCLSMLAVLLLSVTSAAADIDEKVTEIMDKVGKHLKASDTTSVTIDTDISLEAQGMKKDVTITAKLSFQRPDKLALTSESEGMGSTVIVDGEHVYTYLPMNERYMKMDAPETLADAVPQQMVGMTGGIPLIHMLISDNPAKRIMEQATAASYVGKEDYKGTPVHRLRFVESQIDWDLLVAADGDPIILALLPDLSKAMAKLAERNPRMAQLKQTIVVSLSDWQTGIELADDRFSFTPPEGAEAVDSFQALVEAPEREDPSLALIDKPAPAVSLPSLEGDSVSIADHQGKDIVILDFWATWCGPCVRAMPVLSSVAKEYADKNVVLYAINLRETEKEVQAFLKKHDLDVNVLMDKQGATAQDYLVTGIPQTVIIGKDGTVANVHVGFIPGLEKQISAELDALLK